MSDGLTRRSLLGAAAVAVTVPAATKVLQAQESAARGQLSDESLGTLLKAMGLEAKLFDKRYDFVFKANVNNDEWELSMSTVLSMDRSVVWIMAWLDELPRSAADVPRTALLRLLADNDKLGKGKFFAYIASNRRFVLQRVIPNTDITSASFRADLDDLGATVVSTHPHWAVSNWSSPTQPDPSATPATSTIQGSAPQGASTGSQPGTAVRDGATIRR
ncbi:hypothetical protein Plim_2193 [Planctopirus limnophila DSM 3776]|uniref:Uncharacterized protein n=2 Tax=Planctopirus TaxID=1649480 RepID=D5SMW4_PLAL2|nr:MULTISPECIES: hypothetical protein [Planctopirus]ADG68019.1 hypothetical protein Plim_2193 [Planctopirus limnophila DSM 3776]ODA27983.1 hypothetical protein A6X21_14020 [Planctopirus hydrillae]